MKYVMTKRDRAILLIVLGIVILVLTIKFVYLDYTDKTEQLKSANASLQQRVDVLQSIADQQAELVSTTTKNNQLAETIMARFPSNVYEEDVILFGKAMEEFAPYDIIDGIKIGGPEETYVFENIKAQTDEEVKGYIPAGEAPQAPAEGEGDAAATEEAAPAQPEQDDSLPKLYMRKNSITGFTDYDGLKNSIRYIVDSNERCSMAVNANYDIETGILQTNITLGRFYVTGTDKPYVEPEITNVLQGTDNIFGTVPLEESRPGMRSATRDTESNTENSGEETTSEED